MHLRLVAGEQTCGHLIHVEEASGNSEETPKRSAVEALSTPIAMRLEPTEDTKEAGVTEAAAAAASAPETEVRRTCCEECPGALRRLEPTLCP